MSFQRRNKDQIAARIAQDIAEGAYVNLGIGLPTIVANHLPKDREILLHSENGVLGMGPQPPKGEEDPDLINAGKQPVTLLPGASFFHHADSFGMIRGQHLDICVLGAFQVSERGDIANWHTGAPDAIPAVGGAMDLALGAKAVWVMMEHQTKSGESKVVKQCTYPLTGVGCVTRVYSDLCVIDITADGMVAYDLVPGLAFDELRENQRRDAATRSRGRAGLTTRQYGSRPRFASHIAGTFGAALTIPGRRRPAVCGRCAVVHCRGLGSPI